jgi:hypothetical protein
MGDAIQQASPTLGDQFFELFCSHRLNHMGAMDLHGVFSNISLFDEGIVIQVDCHL